MVTETTPSARRGEFDQFAAPVAAVDQLSIDVAPDRFDSEYQFWAADRRAAAIPVHRGSDDAGLDATCYFDFARDDIVAAEQAHVDLGATLVAHRWWTVMGDPSEIEHCLTPVAPALACRAGAQSMSKLTPWASGRSRL